MRFFIEFCSKNALLQQRQHRFRIGFSNRFCLSGTFLRIAFRTHFDSKKPTKNPSKTRSEPFKNRCQKRVVFQHRFFGVSALILEGLDPSRWSQVGQKGPAKLSGQPLFYPLKLKFFKKWRLGGLRTRFWRPRAPFLRPRGSIWERSGAMFSRFLPRMPRLPRTPRTPAKTRPRSQMRQEWVGGGAPPPGGFQ